MAITTLVMAALLAAAQPTKPPSSAPPQSNAELKAMFDADQAARKDIAKIVPMQLYLADAARRKRARAMMAAGQFRTGDDFYDAAFLFQHGDKAADVLLAHTLAMVAMAEGRAGARWIAAATLDRYLQEVGQPQVFGTQYETPKSGVTTQEPYDKDLLPDAMRAVFEVKSRADQEKRRAEIEARNRARQAKP